MENWYVAQTKWAQEKYAQQHLTEQGVTCLLPVFSRVRLRNGRVRGVTPQPLFPGYLFVRFDPEVVHTTSIKGTRGDFHSHQLWRPAVGGARPGHLATGGWLGGRPARHGCAAGRRPRDDRGRGL
ncbi:transcription termination/antitermination NusG family protein [Pantoea rodasii]|uniref:transcription termination/antitermination NusG family protein n=1 Tax=Pantoea rodasii TaxID=1076549 RepID=UPI001FCE1FA2|nr:transcription termination/antitermination NusG family protein [Pantoea rodasii]